MVVPAARASIPATLEAAWQLARDAWADNARHDELLGLAAKHQQFAWLAARYREAARERPGDPVPEARLARLQRAALLTMCCEVRPAATKERMPYRGISMMLIAALVATGMGLWLGQVKTRDYQRQHHAGLRSSAR